MYCAVLYLYCNARTHARTHAPTHTHRVIKQLKTPLQKTNKRQQQPTNTNKKQTKQQTKTNKQTNNKKQQQQNQQKTTNSLLTFLVGSREVDEVIRMDEIIARFDRHLLLRKPEHHLSAASQTHRCMTKVLRCQRFQVCLFFKPFAPEG